MTRMADISRSLISVISFLQGILFLFFASAAYALQGIFHTQWYLRSMVNNATDLLTGLLSFWVAYSLIARHRAAKYLAALLFSWVFVCFLFDVITHPPIELPVLTKFLIPGIALGLLLGNWKKPTSHPMEKLT